MEKSWFNKTSQEVEQELKTDYQKGLSSSQVQENIKKYGLNMLQYAPSDKKLYISRGLPLSDLQFTSWE